ncbi:NADH:flavin oxidoreductase [Motilimonas cestriensis]|uniref:NADH:flavin oxidoreductase n=1 Tax=Motilimonas cestriensis TaxID=2742685 RepID=UPI003DA33F58
MTTNNEILFTPAQIAKSTIHNKLAVAPMTRVSAQEDGTAGPLMKTYYENFARGGFGLIITEGLYTDTLYSQGYFKQPGIATQEQANSWKVIVKGVQHQGAVIIAQLMHAGALSQYNRFTTETIAPSPVPPLGKQMKFYYGDGPYRLPKAMSHDDIEEVVQGFVSSALHAKSAGFDGVEIHGANGYLLDQFLTSYTNQRQDEYGGELGGRLRIYKQIIQAVRHAVGDDFIVGVRFSQKKVNDTEYLWPEGEAAAAQIFTMAKECMVDYIHTTEPMLNEPAFRASIPLSALAKKYSGLPVIANGGVSEPQQAAEVLEKRQTDLVALGKIALSNQDWPNVVKNGANITNFDFAMLSPIADLECAKHFINK